MTENQVLIINALGAPKIEDYDTLKNAVLVARYVAVSTQNSLFL